MIIAECKRLTEVVTDEGGDEAGDEISFSQLKYFELEYLPRFGTSDCDRMPRTEEVL